MTRDPHTVNGSPTGHHWLRDPRKLLMLDAAGAAMTALLTYVVLAGGLLPTGIPDSVLQVMAATAAGFVCFDIAALAIGRSPTVALRAIATLNLTYAVATIGVLAVHRQTVTPLGAAYLGSEILVVVALARWEYRVARERSAPQA
jgi:hypothetical protein